MGFCVVLALVAAASETGNYVQVVQDTVTEAVQEAVAAAFEENGRFDVRANFYTLIAITGVVLYWRGIWNSW